MADTAATFARLQAEGIVSLATAASVHGYSVPAVRRWATAGVIAADGQRVRLEVIHYPGRKVTSLPAVLRFLDATRNPGGNLLVRSPEKRRTAADRAGQFLDSIGI